jgi:Enoyl-CoA hydratase/isomerase
MYSITLSPGRVNRQADSRGSTRTQLYCLSTFSCDNRNVVLLTQGTKRPKLQFFFPKHLSRRRSQVVSESVNMAPPMPSFRFFNLSMPAEYVAHVEINRPNKLNAFYDPMWHDLRAAFEYLSSDQDVRCVLLSGAGPRAFTAGTRLVCAGLMHLQCVHY